MSSKIQEKIVLQENILGFFLLDIFKTTLPNLRMDTIRVFFSKIRALLFSKKGKGGLPPNVMPGFSAINYFCKKNYIMNV